MKIMKVITDCIQCDYLYSDGISKNTGILCSKQIYTNKDNDLGKISISEIDQRIPETGIPDWCPLEDYEVKK